MFVVLKTGETIGNVRYVEFDQNGDLIIVFNTHSTKYLSRECVERVSMVDNDIKYYG